MEYSLLILLLLPLLLLLLSTSATSPFPPGSLPTTSGYLTINSSAALYFAFYEAQHPLTPPSSTPILVWLQGGPGCSSLLGNFFELGPYLIAPAGDHPLLRPNRSTWNRRFALLFIDNPLGTGFSYTPSPASSIPRDQPTVARHLHAALHSFLSSHPPLRRRPLFLTGESYAGKYIPAAAYHILRHNPRLPDSNHINLVGVAVGDGITHPVVQVATHAATAYYTGLINDRQRTHLERLLNESVRLTLAANWSAATDARSRALNWLQNATGLATQYDFTRWRPYATEMVGVFLNDDAVRAALGAARNGPVWEECSKAVGEVLHADLMKSVKYEVEEVVKSGSCRVLLYTGLYDLRLGVVSTEAWLKEMEWDGLEEFLAAERKVWMVDGERAGYVQRSGSLTHAVVSGAGHLVPADRGRSAQALIEDWVMEQGLFAAAEEEVRTSY